MSQRIILGDGGWVLYDPDFLDRQEALTLFEALRDTAPWRQERGPFGRPFPRLTAYYSDPGLRYTYSGVTHEAHPWTPVLLALRRRVEVAAGAEVNTLLVNFYRNGNDSIGFHADDEPELGVNPVVPSLSLGATRTFVLRHKRRGERHRFDLTDGALLVMAGTLQHHYQHAVPKSRSAVGPRINLTFRKVYADPG